MCITLRKLKYRFRPPPKRRRHPAPPHLRAAVISILVICAAAVFLFIRLEVRLGTAIQQSALSKLNSTVTKFVNISVCDIMDSEGIDTQKLILAQYDSGGKIISLTADYNAVNRIKSQLAVKIQEQTDALDTIDTSIPAGLLFSDTAMTGFGIRLKFRVFAINSISLEFNEEFSSAGINQTKYKLTAAVKVPLCVAGVACREETEVVTQVPIAETIIVGDVPSAYLEGVR